MMSKVILRGSLTQMAEQVLAHLLIDRKTPDYERLRRVALDELLAVWKRGGFMVGDDHHAFKLFDDDDEPPTTH